MRFGNEERATTVLCRQEQKYLLQITQTLGSIVDSYALVVWSSLLIIAHVFSYVLKYLLLCRHTNIHDSSKTGSFSHD